MRNGVFEGNDGDFEFFKDFKYLCKARWLKGTAGTIKENESGPKQRHPGNDQQLLFCERELAVPIMNAMKSTIALGEGFKSDHGEGRLYR